MNLPEARSKNIVTQESGSETLVYDLIINKAYCLNETSSIVFHACGSNQSFEDLKAKYNFTDDLIYLSLDELKRNNLIVGEYISLLAGIKRREVIRRIGITCAAMLPVISFLTAPTAVSAQSICSAPSARPGGCPCTTPAQCAFPCCQNNICRSGGAVCGFV